MLKCTENNMYIFDFQNVNINNDNFMPRCA